MRARTWQWIGFGLGLAIFLILFLDVRLHGPVSGADQGIYDRVTALQAHGFPANALGEAVTQPVSVPGAVILTVVATLLFWLLRDRRTAFWAALSGLVAGAAIYSLKQSIQRPLPPHVAGAWYKWSFPSGHIISAVANVGFLWLLLAQVVVDLRGLEGRPAKRMWAWGIAAWATWAVVMGVARILTQDHWADDVYASWAVGVALACGLLLVARLPWPPDRHPEGEPFRFGAFLRSLRGPGERA
ncbi:MAG: phosphatase PAP2 family protein [Thermoplasmatota archaeon]